MALQLERQGHLLLPQQQLLLNPHQCPTLHHYQYLQLLQTIFLPFLRLSIQIRPLVNRKHRKKAALWDVRSVPRRSR